MTVPPPRHLGNGVVLIPAPLPFRSPAWVNVYAIEHEDGLTLIDCGADWPAGWDAIVGGAAALGIDLTTLDTLIVSHLHPDHVGMAGRVLATFGGRLLMHRNVLDDLTFYNDTPAFVRWLEDLLAAHGMPPDRAKEASDVGARPGFMPAASPPDLVVQDGDRIPLGSDRHLEVIHTPGHDRSHICLRDSTSGAIFSGDHILGRITPVIMWTQHEDDVLGDYLASLQRIVDLGAGMTYPAHESLIARGAERAHQIYLHHLRRLDGMFDVVAQRPATAWTVMGRVYRPHLSPLDQRLAMRETIAHLEHLAALNRIAADRTPPITYAAPPGDGQRQRPAG